MNWKENNNAELGNTARRYLVMDEAQVKMFSDVTSQTIIDIDFAQNAIKNENINDSD